MVGRSLALLAIAGLALAACSDDPGYVELPDETTLPVEVAEEVDQPAAEVERPPPDPDIGDGLILVFDRDGGSRGLATYTADGTLVTELADSDDDSLIWQPIWSPDASRIAWTASTDSVTWELVTAAADGTDRTSHPLPARPDYITFDPTATNVLALTPSADGFGVVIADLSGTAAESVGLLDIGRPYYSDFAPEGDRFVAHVGTAMRIVHLDGERTLLDYDSNGFQTPTWHPDGESLLFTIDDGGANVLVRHHLPTGSNLALGTFQRFALFSVDPTGARVAVSSFGGSVQPGAADAAAAPQDDGRGGLFVIDLETGATDRLSDRPTSAPMWDPTGTRFLARNAVIGVGEWTVWDLAGETAVTDTFDVTDTLAPAYLPFWDQFSKSQTLWSPDGQRFVHVGAPEGGAPGVWIHDAAESGASTFLVDGDHAFWSPA